MQGSEAAIACIFYPKRPLETSEELHAIIVAGGKSGKNGDLMRGQLTKEWYGVMQIKLRLRADRTLISAVVGKV